MDSKVLTKKKNIFSLEDDFAFGSLKASLYLDLSDYCLTDTLWTVFKYLTLIIDETCFIVDLNHWRNHLLTWTQR